MIPVLDLCSGSGIYSLGLENTGYFKTVAFCENDDYCQRLLNKHWPQVPVYDDIQTFTGDQLRSDGIEPQCIIAGWPCQDISPAGTGHGLDGARSGLWIHISRIIGDVRPAIVILENSSNLLAINDGRDFGVVLGNLASLGYDAEWHCLSAAGFDAPHIRDRLWIIATCSNADYNGFNGSTIRRSVKEGERKRRLLKFKRFCASPDNVSDAYGIAPIGAAIARQERHTWRPEPGMGRMAPRRSDTVDRIRVLGNLNPPIIPDTIGRAIIKAVEIGSEIS